MAGVQDQIVAAAVKQKLRLSQEQKKRVFRPLERTRGGIACQGGRAAQLKMIYRPSGTKYNNVVDADSSDCICRIEYQFNNCSRENHYNVMLRKAIGHDVRVMLVYFNKEYDLGTFKVTGVNVADTHVVLQKTCADDAVAGPTDVRLVMKSKNEVIWYDKWKSLGYDVYYEHDMFRTASKRDYSMDFSILGVLGGLLIETKCGEKITEEMLRRGHAAAKAKGWYFVIIAGNPNWITGFVVVSKKGTHYRRGSLLGDTVYDILTKK
jgi:hypothetical protein